MSKWLVMLFYTIGLAGVVYFSFRSLLFSSITADQFPNGRFLFSLATVIVGAWLAGWGIRKYIIFASNNREREAASEVYAMHNSGDWGSGLVVGKR
ncbi:putative permease [Anoxybacillus tepidamans]|uniref:Putative permease n=1 Tax=Anoxybacteroides tepidamans TaxID=265948 RepID=A0A7W8IMM6_9BACL|nr:hypothetical protein [Anoxybacillus tepidamans]MBB5323298.1 putative permease [Anoxybacillus tepidamans]